MIIGKIRAPEILQGDHEHFIYEIVCEKCGCLFGRSNYIAEEFNCDLRFCCYCCGNLLCPYRLEKEMEVKKQ